MSVQPPYPGVHIEELPSGTHTITGVATSITAFIGRALCGPVNQSVPIRSYSDYERIFGGLWIDSTMSYAVRDFYNNGGSQATIVRIARNATTAMISLTTGGGSPPGPLVLLANSPGAWGSALSASVNYSTQDPTSAPSSPPNPAQTAFNLVIYENGTQVEQFLNVSMDPSDIKYLPRILQQSSTYVVIGKDSSGNWIVPGGIPAATPNPVSASTGLDGDVLTSLEYLGDENKKEGMYALKTPALFNLLCIPPPVRGTDTDPSVYQQAMSLCAAKRAFLIVDPPLAWGASAANATNNAQSGLSTLGLSGIFARNAALYFPLVQEADPLRKNQVDTFVPSGIIAGVMALTDSNRGVWKSPAGIDAALNGIVGLQANLTDEENAVLNPLGINCLRNFPVAGNVVWGARTLRGADQLGDDDNKYVAVRRMTLFLEESLYQGTQWVVFEPNAEPLWAQIRLNVGAFMQSLFRQGAFKGTTPKEAYLVKCDSETTTQTDINQGIVNILVAFAPLKPAEFVVIQIQQLAGQLDS